MAEVVLGVVGLVPVLVQALKTFRCIHRSIKTARKCIEHLDAIATDWRIQHVRFSNECVLLLLECGEEQAVGSAMVKDPTHPAWKQITLEASFKARLGDSFEPFGDIIRKIGDVFQKMERMMWCFDTVRRQKLKDDSFKVTFKRLCQSIRFTFDEGELKQQICMLGERNGHLEVLRNQRAAFNHHNSRPNRLHHQKPIPHYYPEVQQISAEAHRALSSCFNCSDATHHEHTALIALDVQYEQGVRLDMAFTHRSRCESGLKSDPPVKFLLRPEQVDSVSTVVTEELVSTIGQQHNPRARPIPLDPLASQNSCPTADGSAFSTYVKTRIDKRKRKVAFSGPPQAVKRASTSVPRPGGPDPALDLSAISEVCNFLRQRCDAKDKAKAISSYIAFLQQSHDARYIFYLSSMSYSVPSQIEQRLLPPESLMDYVINHYEDTITVVQVYKLALKMTRAVLQFHCTPWFGDEWDLAQLLVIQDANGAEAEDIPLYINSQIGTLPNMTTAPQGAIHNHRQTILPASQQPLSPAQQRGVDNVPLFCLGTALLEVAHWRPINSLRKEYDNDNIDTIRRVANGRSMLGKWYDEAVRKCLRCDFAFGTDLGRIELQRAVYADIVCPLEDLIERMDNMAFGDL